MVQLLPANCGFLGRHWGGEGVNDGPLEPLLRVTDVRNSAPGCISDVDARTDPDIEGRIAALAHRQGGHVTRVQLGELGLRRGAVEARLKRGVLIRVHRGVYAVGYLPTNPLDRARGALLAAGPRSALRERSAAAYWGLYTRYTGPIELISPLQRRIPGLNISHCGTLIRRDIRAIDGIRVTSPARTMLDIAPRTATKHLHRFHNELRMRRLIDNDRLLDVAARNPLHPGAKHLRALAGESAGEAKRSTFEVDWQFFAKKYDVPPHVINVNIAGEKIDVLFTPRPLDRRARRLGHPRNQARVRGGSRAGFGDPRRNRDPDDADHLRRPPQASGTPDPPHQRDPRATLTEAPENGCIGRYPLASRAFG